MAGRTRTVDLCLDSCGVAVAAEYGCTHSLTRQSHCSIFGSFPGFGADRDDEDEDDDGRSVVAFLHHQRALELLLPALSYYYILLPLALTHSLTHTHTQSHSFPLSHALSEIEFAA